MKNTALYTFRKIEQVYNHMATTIIRREEGKKVRREEGKKERRDT